MGFGKSGCIAVTLALHALSNSAPLQAAPHAPTDREVEAMCPGIGLPGLVLGAERASQDAASTARITRPGSAFPPFSEADLDYTDWSDRLAAVTWRAASPDGETNMAWREALEGSLAAAGWTAAAHSGLSSSFAMNGSMVSKRFETGGEPRTLLVEYDTPGMLLLRCGDLQLLELDAMERRGELPAGTPRPQTPAAQPYTLPEEAECDRPELRAAFAGATSLAQIGPVIEAHFPASDPGDHSARHGERLNRWLEWKLRMSGKVTQERLWEIAEKAAPIDREEIGRMTGTLGALGQAMDAHKSGDPGRTCKAMIGALRAMHEDGERKAARWARHNAVLEAEARRLGIAVD